MKQVRRGRTAKLGQLWRLVRESHAQPMTGSAQRPVLAGAGEASVMFVGHSSFLLGMGGKHVLVDPVFATRLIVMRRQRRPGVRVEDLPAIDAVLLTHAHMDHLNRPTLRKVAQGDEAADRQGAGGSGAEGGGGPAEGAGVPRGEDAGLVAGDGGCRAEGDADTVQALGGADVYRYAPWIWRVCDRRRGAYGVSLGRYGVLPWVCGDWAETGAGGGGA